MRIVQKIYILEKSYKIWRIHRNVKKLNNNIMRLTKSKFKRPRCENCGVKFFPKNKPFREASFLFGDLPIYCPDCGKEISNEKRAQLDEYSTKIYCLWCIWFISFVIVVLVIVTLI